MQSRLSRLIGSLESLLCLLFAELLRYKDSPANAPTSVGSFILTFPVEGSGVFVVSCVARDTNKPASKIKLYKISSTYIS